MTVLKKHYTPLRVVSILLGSLMPSLHGQGMPRENVVEVPATPEGLSFSNLFQSNMVLQREKPITIWGWGEPGEQVTLTFAGQSKSATLGSDGAWKVSFEPQAANATPQSLVLQGGEKKIVLENILLGDVWVLGGQSNMEFELAKVENGPLEIVSANFPQIRVLTVPYGEGPEEKVNFARLHEWSGWFGRHFRKGDWDPCTPEIARDLSAIGYVFGRRLHMASQVPIGIIDASRGGTTVETWTPKAALEKIDSPFVKQKLAQWNQKVADFNPQADLQNRLTRYQQQIEKLEAEQKPIPADLKEPSELLPGPIADNNYPGNCYAGMLAPLAGLSIKGAIFHQGYNNAFEGSFGAQMYRDIFPVMIQSWREAFQDPELPFGILSLCTEGLPQTRENALEKMYDAGVFLRAAQYETFRDLSQSGDQTIGFVSTYDLRRRWYHPQLKLPAGERIARWALATQYGFEREISWKPPVLLGMEKSGEALVLEFDQDLSDPEDGAMEGFVVAGEDGRFQLAEATHLEKGQDNRGRAQFDRKKIVLRSSLVPNPIHFRYAWARNPLANVQIMGNKDIPLPTQRSDDWLLEEVPLGIHGDEEIDPQSRPQRNRVIQALREEDARRRVFEAEKALELLKK